MGKTMQRSTQWWPALPLLLLAGQLSLAANLAGPSHSAPSDAEEEAVCEQVSRNTTENSAPVMEALERLARQRYGRPFSELTPEQVMQLAMVADVQGREMTPAQQRLQDRCSAYQQRRIAQESAAGGFRSLLTAQGYLDRWGQEQVAGLGCTCPGFPLAGEDVDQICPTRPACPGQQGGPRLPDPARGCRSMGAAAWIRQQLPEFYRILAMPADREEVRDVAAALAHRDRPAVCAQLPMPSSPQFSLASLSSPSAPAVPAGSAFPAAISSAAACFATPTAPLCQEAMVRGDALVVAANRAGRERCLGYALPARTLWALGADPGFTDLLISFPAASRLRNEARIALRYLRVDCRGL